MARPKSFQNEIPPSRVNIRYVKYIGNAQEQVELPLKLLLAGDYTLRPDDTPVEERKRININMTNFNEVMKEQELKLSVWVPNRLSGNEDDKLKVDLSFESLKDFSPDRLVEAVPELKELLKIRELLKDLKSRVITNREFRQALEKVIQDQDKLAALQDQLSKMAPLEEESPAS